MLLLEGVEKAERNVLPLLNNLLENREMALEDGGFLTPRADFAGAARTRRAHRDFIVIAVGRPAARYARKKDDDACAPLDPPLRSRFACRRVAAAAPSEEAAACAPFLESRTRDALAASAAELRSLGDGDDAFSPRFPDTGGASAARLLGAFDGVSAKEVFERAFPVALFGDDGCARGLAAAARSVDATRQIGAASILSGVAAAAGGAFRRGPRVRLTFGAAAFDAPAGPSEPLAFERPASAGARQDEIETLSVKELKRRLEDAGATYGDCREKSELRAKLRKLDAKSAAVAEAAAPDLAPTQRLVVNALCQDAAAGAPCPCVVGRGGEPKAFKAQFLLTRGGRAPEQLGEIQFLLMRSVQLLNISRRNNFESGLDERSVPRGAGRRRERFGEDGRRPSLRSPPGLRPAVDAHGLLPPRGLRARVATEAVDRSRDGRDALGRRTRGLRRG